ncbi:MULTISPECIES: uroporphyrinogen-III synthase [unclassified Sinorhizobium]|uniref:uroporphyrinogen-III synthase n=1 Tax=unclassified Sinorhizobium TaxID=2613772 RepID=UPI003525C0AD
MRVIVTRPEHSGERTAQRLSEMGHEPIGVPLSRPMHTAQAAKDALSIHAGPIAITSAEAVRAIAELGPFLTPHLTKPVFAVGKATAEKARKTGFTTIHVSEGSGVDLADLVAGHFDSVSSDAVLYLAGMPRAAGFETRLRELDIPFHVIECYHMAEIQHEAGFLPQLFSEKRPQAVLLYSRRTAEQFFRLANVRAGPDLLKNLRILCLSPAIADLVPSDYRQNVAVASVPEEDSLLTLLDGA